MGYILKRIKMVSKKNYHTSAFCSMFSIDQGGSLYIYTTAHEISRVDIDRTVEDYTLPGREWTENESDPCLAPIVTEDGIFHIRYENGYYILKTDMNMKELYRISLEGGYSRWQCWYDNYFYYTVTNKKTHPSKTILVKMDTNGTIYWKYFLKEEDLSDRVVVPLNDGKVIIPVERNSKVYKLHVIDRDGKLLFAIENLKLETRARRPDIKIIKDNMGNVCICSMHMAGREYPYVLYVIVLNSEGKELYRNTIELFITRPFLFLNGKNIYEDFSNYPYEEVIKVDITNGTTKTIFSSTTMISSMGICADGKMYICQSGEKQSWLTCFDKEEKELWQFTIKERILMFEVKGDYLYLTTKNKICIYQIVKELIA